jgi:hypothetical protein
VVSVDPFEHYAEDYDRWFEEHRTEYGAELATIRRVLPAPDSRAVEVGVGSGRFAAPLGIGLGSEPARALGRMARRGGSTWSAAGLRRSRSGAGPARVSFW